MSKRSILVVDDERQFAEYLSTVLTGHNFQVITCHNGFEAIKALKENLVDLAVVDLFMPAMDGLELVGHLRSMGINIPVIIITGQACPEETLVRLGDYGIASVLSKPVAPQDLLEAISKAIGRTRGDVSTRKEKGSLKKRIRRLSEAMGDKPRELTETTLCYPQLFELSGQPILLISKGKIVYANSKGLAFTGYNASELLGKEIISLLTPKDKHKLWNLAKRVLKEDSPQIATFEVAKRDGSFSKVEATVTLAAYEGRPAFLAVLKDITVEERRRQITEAILRACPWGIYITKGNRFLFVNHAFLEYTRYTWEELMNLSPQDLVYVEDLKTVRENTIKQLKGELLTPQEYRYVDRLGNVKWASQKTMSIIDSDGRKELAFILDITHLKEAEQNLIVTIEELTNTVNAISSILISTDPNGKVRRLNKAAAQILSIPEGDCTDLNLDDIFKNTDLKKIKEAFKKCINLKRKVAVDDLRYTHKNGKTGFLGFNLFPTIDKNGNVIHVTLIGADITEKKLLMDQILQSQKLEAIGQLAAGIAHEINTPIQYIGDNLRFIRSGLQDLAELIREYKAALISAKPDSEITFRLKEREDALDLDYILEELPKAVEQSLDGVDRISKIVLSVKNFAHPGLLEKVQFDLNNAIESTVNISRNVWKYVADLELRLDPGLPPVYGFPGELNQVLLNLILNAVHAIEEKGDSKKGKIVIESKRENNFAVISIQDTGTGIPEEIRERIFEPFFTTKAPGKGTGQGLAISYRYVVELHQGQLYFTSELGKGTTFFIKIPIS